jgi:hypothetical protein
MVVLEGANINSATMPMLTIGNNQYLQPDYLSPNPSMVRILINSSQEPFHDNLLVCIFFSSTVGRKKESVGFVGSNMLTNRS